MTSPFHKGSHHKWNETEVRHLAEQGTPLELLAKHFNVKVGAMLMFCKRKGIQIAGYRYRQGVGA